MTKRFCDICGKEMSTIAVVSDSVKFATFAISEYGRLWDVCDGCRKDLAAWIKDRKERPVCQESQSQ